MRRGKPPAIVQRRDWRCARPPRRLAPALLARGLVLRSKLSVVPLLAAVLAIAALALPAVAGAKDKTKWLCEPGKKNDPCHVDLTATVLKSDGSSSVER